MAYTIKVTYTTGDSFNTHNGCVCHVGAIWRDIEEARVALHCIKAHYEASKERGRKKIEEYKGCAWYSKDYPEMCLMVPIDSQWKKISASTWCGYFERLEELEIVLYYDEDEFKNPNKITF